MSELVRKHNLFVAGLQQRKGFKDWLDDVEKNCPSIPSFDPGDHAHRKEHWAYFSGMKEGYKLALSHLGVQLDE